MKRIVIVCSCLVLFAMSCNKASVDSDQVCPKLGIMINKVTLSDVHDYLVTEKGITGTKANTVSVEPILNGLDTVMYLVNYENGWEVLSGDIRISKVLIHGDAGNISVNELMSNPSSHAVFDALSSGLSRIKRDAGFESPSIFKDSWENSVQQGRPDGGVINTRLVAVVTRDTLAYDIRYRDHLLQTKWGQGDPWNQCCPYTDYTFTSHCKAGCVPVAAAQVLYYCNQFWGVPYESYGFAFCNEFVIPGNYLVLNPSQVVLGLSSPSVWGEMALTSSSPGTNKVAPLLLQLGLLYQAKYYSDGTEAYTTDASTVFPQFGLDCQVLNLQQSNNPASDMINIFENQIYDESLPVIMSVRDTLDDYGHSVVVDGYYKRYIYIRNTIDYYIIGFDELFFPGQQLPDHTEYSFQTENTTSVAINWGWNGDGDSWAGSTIWYNAFSAWLVFDSIYSEKKYMVYGFEPLDE